MPIQKVTVIVPAAGRGTRTNLQSNKVLAPLAGKPVLSWTLQALSRAKVLLCENGFDLVKCIIVARREEFNEMRKVADFHNSLSVKFVEGGNTRQQSVHNGIKTASGQLIIIHDAARPLASPQLFVDVAKAARESGAAIAALPARDTVKIAAEVDAKILIKSTFERARVWLAQTPQAFDAKLLRSAYLQAERDNFIATDSASVVENSGKTVAIVRGELKNVKITYAEDFNYAEFLLKSREHLSSA